jgi:hypothetical protein
MQPSCNTFSLPIKMPARRRNEAATIPQLASCIGGADTEELQRVAAASGPLRSHRLRAALVASIHAFVTSRRRREQPRQLIDECSRLTVVAKRHARHFKEQARQFESARSRSARSTSPARAVGLAARGGRGAGPAAGTRDAERDDRVTCADCQHYSGRSCAQSPCRGLGAGNVGRGFAQVLQRCPGFGIRTLLAPTDAAGESRKLGEWRRVTRKRIDWMPGSAPRAAWSRETRFPDWRCRR